MMRRSREIKKKKTTTKIKKTVTAKEVQKMVALVEKIAKTKEEIAKKRDELRSIYGTLEDFLSDLGMADDDFADGLHFLQSGIDKISGHV